MRFIPRSSVRLLRLAPALSLPGIANPQDAAQARNLLGEDIYLGYGENLRYRRAGMNKGTQFLVNLIFRP